MSDHGDDHDGDRDGDRDGSDGLAALTEAVKSRILDRVLADLRADLALGSQRHGYTKSDSGIYGKYQKQDIDLAAILEVVKAQTERLVAEYAQDLPPRAGDEGQEK